MASDFGHMSPGIDLVSLAFSSFRRRRRKASPGRLNARARWAAWLDDKAAEGIIGTTNLKRKRERERAGFRTDKARELIGFLWKHFEDEEKNHSNDNEEDEGREAA